MPQIVAKFDVRYLGRFQLELPHGAQILHVAAIGPGCRSLSLWAMVDVEAEKEPRMFVMAVTGETLPAIALSYCGSFFLDNGVESHLFETTRADGAEFPPITPS